MPYPNWHAARVKSPSLFEKDSFRTKAIASGITIIVGRLKEEISMTTQTYRFDKDDFTPAEAKKWLSDNDVEYISFEEAADQPQKVQSFVRLITSEVQSLSQNEIMKLIPGDTLAKIRETDPHPFFKAYSIAHEGLSTPSFLDIKSKPIRWFKKAVQSIKNIALKGVKFFINHGKGTNEHEGREQVGEVVADGQKYIDGKLHHIVVGYFKDKSKVAAMDICSQEAEWTFWDYVKEYVASTVEKITGIALSDSRYDKPAFADAKCIGMIQAFDREDREGRKENNMPGEIDLSTIPVNQIVQEIKRRQMKPLEIFSIEEVKAIKEVQDMSADRENLKKTVGERDETIKALESEKSGLLKQSEMVTAKDRLGGILKDKQATDRQSQFVLEDFDKEIPDDLTDEGLNAFVGKSIDRYTRAVRVGGVPQDEPTPPPKKTSSSQEPEDYTSPENNELLEPTT